MEATRNSPSLQILRVDCWLVSRIGVLRLEAKVEWNQSPIAVEALNHAGDERGMLRSEEFGGRNLYFFKLPGPEPPSPEPSPHLA